MGSEVPTHSSEVPTLAAIHELPSTVAGLTASIVSHGQMGLANLLIGDLIRHAGPQLRRLVLTLNVPEPEPVQAEGAPFELIVLRNSRPLGFGANHNRAFRHCDSEWFAVLNPDIRLSSDALGQLLAAGGPRDGLIAPLIMDADGRAADSARRLPTPLQLMKRRLIPHQRGADPDFEWLAGMCLLLNSEAFRSLNGFDERFFMYCEDVDLCLRMQLAGRCLRHVPAVRPVHDARRASHRSPRYLLWHLASLMRLWTSATYWSYLPVRHRLAALRQTGADQADGGSPLRAVGDHDR
jgi:N-acetylglucosaminyl-diphospho-decaprenol L-rhamnosyltransferase